MHNNGDKMSKLKKESTKSTEDMIKDAIEALKIQQSEHQTMAVKAQGALDVLLQLQAQSKEQEGKQE